MEKHVKLSSSQVKDFSDREKEISSDNEQRSFSAAIGGNLIALDAIMAELF